MHPPDLSPTPLLRTANTGMFGLLPADGFTVGSGMAAGGAPSPQVRWLFRDETIAIPTEAAADLPPLVWVGARLVGDDARLSGPQALTLQGHQVPFELAARHPLNRSYFDEHSLDFLARRQLRIRGDWLQGKLAVRTFWPEDFRLPAVPPMRPLPNTETSALRARIRELPQGGARSPFSVETLWQRPGSPPASEGRPVLACILNGAQGDDDEAHGGHFAMASGVIGPEGSMADWLVDNYYTLDTESEKGIIAAPVPLDNYLADLNSGQAWYRPSCMLVAVLRQPRTALRVQGALFRIFDQFYRHRFSYQHARANCAGITLDALRMLGWQIPCTGAESWARAIVALPATALITGSLRKGKAAFDYLTEEGTRLLPALAFEAIGCDLLRLATGSRIAETAGLEAALVEDLDALLFVRIPQFPSSRAWGDFPVASIAEYRRRMPASRSDRKIVPVAPRPFPRELIEADAPVEPPLRSDYAVAAYLLAAAAVTLLLAL